MELSNQTGKQNQTHKPSRVWLVLIAGPVLFLIGIVLTSIYFGFITQGKVDAIPELVASTTPYQLLIIQFLLKKVCLLKLVQQKKDL